MFDKRNILITFIFITIQETKTGNGEWVEIPQFSDDAKVYRMPFTKYGSGNSGTRNSFPNFTTMDEDFRRIRVKQKLSVDTKDLDPTPFSEIESSRISITTEAIYLSTSEESTEKIVEEDEAEVSDEEEDEDFVTKPTIYIDDRIDVEKNQTYQVNSTENFNEPEKMEEEKEDKGFLYYVPLELFKKVHATLKSQPATLKGKIGFLKNFEKTLLTAIGEI